MDHPYKTRFGGATVTVFVPYDCRNHCPFCINKQEYTNCSGFSEARIIDGIRTIDAITPVCDVVFTGGEPFANLGSLQRMLNAVPATHKIYINTTFPVQPGCSAEEMLDFVARNRDKITCLNVSRHLSPYVEESPDEVVAAIAVPKRINCVLYRDYPSGQLMRFADRWRKWRIPIQFRYDYTETTPENLYETEHDPIFQDLKAHFTYMGLDGCRMRNGFHFRYQDLHMTYHKTLPYSTIVETGDDGVTYDILYDLVIKQDGALHSDWTGAQLDVEKYRRVVYEPYDLKVLDGTVDDGTKPSVVMFIDPPRF